MALAIAGFTIGVLIAFAIPAHLIAWIVHRAIRLATRFRR